MAPNPLKYFSLGIFAATHVVFFTLPPENREGGTFHRLSVKGQENRREDGNYNGGMWQYVQHLDTSKGKYREYFDFQQ